MATAPRPTRLAARLAVAAVTAALAAGTLTACRSDSTDRDRATVPSLDGEASEVCPGGTRADDGLVTCDDLFADGAPVRLPADPGDDARFGAIVRGGGALWTREGVVPLSEAATAQVTAENADSGSAVIADGMPYASQVYGARIEDGTVVELRPVVRVAEDAIVARTFAGAVLEGTISGFRDGGYDASIELPVRIEVADRAADGSLDATIVNADEPVRSSTGTCLPALSADAATNPLRAPFSAAIGLERYPSMHADFDDEMLLTWGDDTSDMGADFYPSMATIMGGDPLAEQWDVVVHGTPTAGPALLLTRVEGGGDSCA